MKRSPQLAPVTLALAFVLGVTASAFAQVTPGNVTFLDVPIAGGWSITPTSINDHGVVTANIGLNGPPSAMLWDKTAGWRNIGGTGVWTYPEAINNNGVVAAMNLAADFSHNQGLLWDEVNQWRPMQLGPGVGIFPRDINDNNVVVGHSWNGSFTYSETAGVEYVDDIDPVAINNAGVIAGSVPGSNPQVLARRDANGVVTPLPSGPSALVEDINNAGQIGGGLYQGGIFSGAVWAPDGTLTVIPPLGGSDVIDIDGFPARFEFARVTAINDLGQAVGITTTNGGGFNWVPFVWDPVSGMREVALPGYSNVWPVGINNIGEVVARVINGHDRGVYFTVPPPAPPTPQAATEAIADEIQELVTSGALSASNASSITTKLDAAVAALDRGNVNAAGNQLNAAINRVNALVNSGKLTAAQGQEIRAALQGVINSL